MCCFCCCMFQRQFSPTWLSFATQRPVRPVAKAAEIWQLTDVQWCFDEEAKVEPEMNRFLELRGKLTEQSSIVDGFALAVQLPLEMLPHFDGFADVAKKFKDSVTVSSGSRVCWLFG